MCSFIVLLIQLNNIIQVNNLNMTRLNPVPINIILNQAISVCYSLIDFTVYKYNIIPITCCISIEKWKTDKTDIILPISNA